MKKTVILIFVSVFIFSSCIVDKSMPTTPYTAGPNTQNNNITQSLFSDKEATISEENIQQILSGNYSLPSKIRVGIINLENTQSNLRYWDNEDYLSSRQKYLDIITVSLKNNPRVQSVSLIPQMMLPAAPTFASIREAAVRTQADIIVVYSISGGMYANYKVFKSSIFKSFATTQALVIDTRTGLVPFTRVISDDEVSKKSDKDFNEDEARKRIQENAVLKTLEKICTDLDQFLE